MSRINKLRERSKLSQEIYDKKVQRAVSAVSAYMNSEASKLTIARHIEDADDVTEVTKFSQDIATRVADAVLDPVAEFKDICNARGYSEVQVDNIIHNYSRLFGLATNGTKEEKTKAVAEYLQYNKLLYEDLDYYK